MSFRVTPQILVSQVIENARRHSANLLTLQQQASTGLRVFKPSDDPLATRALLARRDGSARIDSQLSNIRDTRSKLNLEVSHLLEANTIFVRAKEVALQAGQSSEAATLANQVQSLLDNLLAVANAQDDGQFIFAGTAVDTQPFVVGGANPQGADQEVLYAGSLERTSAAVGTGHSVEVLYTGDEIFQQRDRQATLMLGDTGAAVGSGTDNAFGQGTLSVHHAATSYAAGSGVAPGSSTVDGDTIIGPAGSHVLTINDTSGSGAGGTVSLDGGPPVSFTSTDTDLRVTGPQGAVVYVDTTSITPGFVGDVAITADGTLSVDGGSTESPIDFSANQILVHGQTGSVTHIDSTNIRTVGREDLEYQGTSDAFQALRELRDDLLNTRGLTERQRQEALTRRMGDLDRVRRGILDIVGEQSVALENLDVLEGRAQQFQLEIEKVISELESADLSEVVVNLQAEQSLLQFTFASSVGLLDQGFLDFLR